MFTLKRSITALFTAVLLFLAGPLYAQEMEQAEVIPDKDIVEVAVGADDFTTLLAALKTADLLDDLKQDGPYTVFFPTDEAFDKLPEGELNDLLRPENKEKLVTILTYHVVPADVLDDPGTLTSDQLLALVETEIETLPTLQGTPLPINAAEQGFLVGEAAIVTPDIIASNGIIHAIDTVIMPPSDDDKEYEGADMK